MSALPAPGPTPPAAGPTPRGSVDKLAELMPELLDGIPQALLNSDAVIALPVWEFLRPQVELKARRWLEGHTADDIDALIAELVRLIAAMRSDTAPLLIVGPAELVDAYMDAAGLTATAEPAYTTTPAWQQTGDDEAGL